MQKLTLVTTLLSCAAAVAAETASPPAGDPFLREYALTQRYRLGEPTAIHPTPDGKSVLFVRSEPRRPWGSLYRFDVKSGKTEKLLAPEDVLGGGEETLSPAERAQRERTRQSGRGFVELALSDDGRELLTMLSGRLFTIDVASGKASELAIQARPALNPRFSPDGSKVAFVHERDLYVFDRRTHQERRLTRATDPALSNGMAEFIAEEELDRVDGFWWAPDGQSLAYEEADNRGVEQLTLADVAHPESPPERPYYPRAGKTNARLRVGIVPVAGGTTRWVAWDAAELPYLAKVTWKPRAPLTLVVLSRDQKREVVLAVDDQGRTRPLLEERDDVFLDLDPSVPRWLDDGSGFLWSSEASGRRQLELRAADGKLVRALSTAAEGYREVRGGLMQLDSARRQAWFLGAPTAPETQVYRVSLDGGAPVAVTQGPAEREAAFVAHGAVWVEELRGPDGKAHARVHDGDDRVAGELPSVVAAPPFAPRQELVRVGKDQLWAAVVRPQKLDPARKYPVVVDVYGGPHHQQVGVAPSLLRQWLADRGVIVVALDGRGTPGRGRAWTRRIAGDFSSMLDDQVEGLQALGQKYRELDLGRVGIVGWSFGGYASALAVELRPDVFHVAVAGAPVVDWRDYDSAYTERYLGTPAGNRAGYERSSLVTHAATLARPLLIVHGTSDDNVYFLHALKLSDALFRAGRPATLLPLAGYTHRVADPLVVERLQTRIAGFLCDVLLAPRAPAPVSAPAAASSPPPTGSASR